MTHTICTASLFVFLAAFCLVTGNILDSGCHGTRLLGDSILELKCPSSHGQICTRLDLNHCLINDFGILKGQLDGGYSSSCQDCQLAVSTLTCRCKVGGEDFSYTSFIDLNEVVGVNDGRLGCYGGGDSTVCP